MNLLHIKYAVAIAETGSINKAAEKLYIGQPNLSRSIKDLEASLGITVFERTSKGMFLTPDGEVFIRYAKSILKQVDEVEEIFSKGIISKKQFSISVPRASYIAEAFVRFSQMFRSEIEVEALYRETNAIRAIKNILQEDYRLGIIRYAEHYDKYYRTIMDKKNLNYKTVAEFSYVLIMHGNHPLANKEEIAMEDLDDYIELAHADSFVPSLPLVEVKKEELSESIRRRIFVFERASQFELLSRNRETFMWVSPVPQSMLDRYDLVQRVCKENKKRYKDVLIHRTDYILSDLDHLFLSELNKSKEEIF